MIPKAIAIGIDVGGSSIKGALISDKGCECKPKIMLTQQQLGPREVIKKIAKIVRELKYKCPANCKIVGIGVGSPGPFDNQTGELELMPNLEGWNGLNLKNQLSELFDGKIVVINDADAAAVGEYYFGCCSGMDCFGVITLGTGIGSSLVLNGKLWSGAANYSPELGHVPISIDGPECSCGGIGHLESYISIPKIMALTKEKMAAGFKTSMLPETLDEHLLKGICDHAVLNDELACWVLAYYAEKLGCAMAILINLINPPKIVLSGGFAWKWQIIKDNVMLWIRRKSFTRTVSKMRIEISEKSDIIGFLGAGAYLLSQWDRRYFSAKVLELGNLK